MPDTTTHRCDGACDEHSGSVRRVNVWFGARSFGKFWYCDTAVEDDRRNGFTVTDAEVDDHA